MSRPPRLTMEQSEALSHADCSTCGGKASEQRGGINGGCWSADRGWYAQCVPCWNASVEENLRQRKAELAARPDCEACGKRKVTCTLRPNERVSLGMCGRCAKRARHNLRQPMLFAAGWGHVTRESLIAAALTVTAARRAS